MTPRPPVQPGHLLEELPLPPQGRTGWPWTEASPRLPPLRPDGSPWPRVSVVTPSFNQAAFLEETIRSVLLQGYPDLEYVIVDGGSTDGSLEIIRRYAGLLAHWSSGPDRGQSHAINTGFAHCTGLVWAWLASDDVYLPGTVGRAAELLGREAGTRLVYGSAQFIDALGHPISLYPGRPLPRGWRRMRYWQGWDIPQPTLFFDRSLFQEHGQLDESLHYALDYDWLLRVLRHSEAACLSETLALYRMHPHSKTGDWHSRKHLFFSELIKVNRRHAPPWLPRWWPLWFSWLAHESAGLSRRLARGAVRVLKTSTGATRAT